MKLHRTISITLLLVASLTLFQCRSTTNIVEPGWVYLGRTKAGHIRERDVIKVQTQDLFTALRIYVKEKNINITSMKVHLINGDILQPAIETTIPAGESSRIIELAADGRQLSYIEFRYRSEGSIFQKRGVVQVIGKRYNPSGAY